MSANSAKALPPVNLPGWQTHPHRWGFAFFAAISVAVALTIYLSHRSPGLTPAKVAVSANAVGCDKTGFVLTRYQGGNRDVFDCVFASGRDRCVIVFDGLARDVTGTFRILYQGTLGRPRPACLR